MQFLDDAVTFVTHHRKLYEEKKYLVIVNISTPPPPPSKRYWDGEANSTAFPVSLTLKDQYEARDQHFSFHFQETGLVSKTAINWGFACGDLKTTFTQE